MRLRSITLNNIRKFTETRRIDGIGSALCTAEPQMILPPAPPRIRGAA